MYDRSDQEPRQSALDDPGGDPTIATRLVTKDRMVFGDHAGNIDTGEKTSVFHHVRDASDREFIETIPAEPGGRIVAPHAGCAALGGTVDSNEIGSKQQVPPRHCTGTQHANSAVS